MTDCDGLIANLTNANNAARIDLEAIKARAAAATEGPWYSTEFPPVDYRPLMRRYDGARCVMSWPRRTPIDDHLREDAEFIAAARTDVPALIAEVERLRRELDSLRTLAGIAVPRQAWEAAQDEIDRLRNGPLDIVAMFPPDPDLMVSPEGDKRGLAELQAEARAVRRQDVP